MAPIAPNILRTELQCGASDLHWHAYLNCLWEWQESDISFEEYPWDDKMDHHARVCIEEYFSDEPSEKRMERKDDFRDDAARRIRGMRGDHGIDWITQRLPPFPKAKKQASSTQTKPKNYLQNLVPSRPLLIIPLILIAVALVALVSKPNATPTSPSPQRPSGALWQPILADFAPANISVLTHAASEAAAESPILSTQARQRIIAAARNVYVASTPVHSSSQSYLNHIEDFISSPINSDDTLFRVACHPPGSLQSSLIRLGTETQTLLRLVSNINFPSSSHRIIESLDRLLRAIKHHRSFIARIQGLSGTDYDAKEENVLSAQRARMKEMVEEWISLVRSEQGENKWGL